MIMEAKELISINQKKNTYVLNYNDCILTLSGNFDSGNLNWAGIDSQKNEIQLQFGKDRDIKPSSKCWFYFSIQGKYSFLPIKLFFMKTNSLNVPSKIYDLYRPVVKVQDGNWQRHNAPIQFDIGTDNQINFRMTLQAYSSKKIYIALCYPWSVTDNDQYMRELDIKLKKRKDIYFNKEVLIMSPQNRPIHLLALSSGQVSQNHPQDYMEHLFPFREKQSHFKMIKKPLILLTCRVHPGQIGSSYSLMGIIDFLVNGTLEAKKILSQFYFLIVPILNPDGVANGNNRMDFYGQNLNRFYLFPQLEKQPSCYAIKSLVENTRQQLFAFFDLHGHTNKKSCFLFGNSINNMRLQIESVLFAKYLSSICEYVEFKSCNFSKKQMSSKDKNEDFSKEGCARVVIHKWTNSPYCYTLQTGLFKNVKVDDKGIERYGQQFYSPKIYAQVGQKMLLSLFAILKKDKNIEVMRKQVGTYVNKLDKINNKKDKEKEKQLSGKGSKKQCISVKNIKKEEVAKQIQKGHSEKQNQFQQEKVKSIEQILQRNKNYLLSLEADDD